MKSLKDIVSLLFKPLLYLNIGGMAAGAIWLGVVSQWQVVGIGITLVIFSPYILPLLMIPAGIISHFMVFYQKAQQPGRERVMFVISIGYTILILAFWCAGIYAYVMGNVAADAWAVALLWAGTAALAPLFFWISRDQSNIFFMMMVEVAQAAFLVICAIRVWVGVMPPFWLFFGIFSGAMAIAAMGQALYETKKQR